MDEIVELLRVSIESCAFELLHSPVDAQAIALRQLRLLDESDARDLKELERLCRGALLRLDIEWLEFSRIDSRGDKMTRQSGGVI